MSPHVHPEPQSRFICHHASNLVQFHFAPANGRTLATQGLGCTPQPPHSRVISKLRIDIAYRSSAPPIGGLGTPRQATYLIEIAYHVRDAERGIDDLMLLPVITAVRAVETGPPTRVLSQESVLSRKDPALDDSLLYCLGSREHPIDGLPGMNDDIADRANAPVHDCRFAPDSVPETHTAMRWNRLTALCSHPWSSLPKQLNRP